MVFVSKTCVARRRLNNKAKSLQQNEKKKPFAFNEMHRVIWFVCRMAAKQQTDRKTKNVNFKRRVSRWCHVVLEQVFECTFDCVLTTQFVPFFSGLNKNRKSLAKENLCVFCFHRLLMHNHKWNVGVCTRAFYFIRRSRSWFE